MLGKALIALLLVCAIHPQIWVAASETTTTSVETINEPVQVIHEKPVVVHENVENVVHDKPVVVHENVVHHEKPVIVHENVVHHEKPVIVDENVVHHEKPVIVEEKPQYVDLKPEIKEEVVDEPVTETESESVSYQQFRRGHRGCFRDNANRDLPRLAYSGSNSVRQCKTACRNLGFKYAGVQYSKECWCGNSYGKYGQAGNCNMKCTSQDGQICGGTWANNVYRTRRHRRGLGLYERWKKRHGARRHRGGRRDRGGRRHWGRTRHRGGRRHWGRRRHRGGRRGWWRRRRDGARRWRHGAHRRWGRFRHGVNRRWGQFRHGVNRRWGQFRHGVNRRWQSWRHRGQTGYVRPRPTIGYPRPVVYQRPTVLIQARPAWVGGGGYLGCFRDNASRDLPKLAFIGRNSAPLCRAACQRLGYQYAGVQYSSECWCGNSYGKYGRAANCNMKCNGNNGLFCGGSWANNIFRAGGSVHVQTRPAPVYVRPLVSHVQTLPAPVYVRAPTFHVQSGTAEGLGCFRDNANRDLPKLAFIGRNSAQLCRAACQRLGYQYAGVQYSSECWCGNSYGKYGRAANCNMRCNGNNGLFCGGSWANYIFRAGGSVHVQTRPAVVYVRPAPVYVRPAPVYVRPVVRAPVVRHIGCFRDRRHRDLPRLAYSGSNSVENCVATCRRIGFAYAGVQWSRECWCGNSYGRYGGAHNCNMRCTANGGQTCGGDWANNIYKTAP